MLPSLGGSQFNLGVFGAGTSVLGVLTSVCCRFFFFFFFLKVPRCSWLPLKQSEMAELHREFSAQLH